MNSKEKGLIINLTILAWVVLLLGSCSIVQNYDNRIFSFNINDESNVTCEMFVRAPHLGHSEPTPPELNPAEMSDEEFFDAVLTHAEKLKIYLNNERKYLAEDIARHQATCH